MKQWWLHLSIREQRTVIIGSVLLFFIVMYFFIWSPISDTVDTLQQNVVQDSELLSWMKITAPQINVTQVTSSAAHPVAAADLFGTVQQSLLSSGLKSALQNIEQQKAGTIKLTFNSISFDNLINWLIAVQRDYGVSAVEVNLNKVADEGHVKGEIVLQSS